LPHDDRRRSPLSELAPQHGEHLAVVRKAPFAVLREHRLAVCDDVELASPALGDLGVVARLVQLGRETRGP
jgi:hypothetical protein